MITRPQRLPDGVTADEIDRRLEDEFPSSSRWTLYRDQQPLAIAATRTAALYAALIMVRRAATPEMTIIGPRVIDGVNVGIRYPLYGSAIAASSGAIEADYWLARIVAAADDLADLSKTISKASEAARSAAKASLVLRNLDGQSSQAQSLVGWLASETARLYENPSYSLSSPRDYVLLDDRP